MQYAHFWVIVVASALGQAETISAATLDLQSYVSVVVPGETPVTQDDTKSLDTTVFPFEFVRASIAAGSSFNPVSASSSAYGNGDRGVLQFETNGAGALSYASALARLTETYSVSGTGKLTANFRIDGWWGVIGSFEVQAALLHKSADGRTAPDPGQTYPATFVTGMPRAV